MKSGQRAPVKPRALPAGSRVRVVAPASPADQGKTNLGLEELRRLGFEPVMPDAIRCEGYFAGSTAVRRQDLLRSFTAKDVGGVLGLRGGYGSNYLLDEKLAKSLKAPKTLIGFSDLTSLQIYLWQRCGWVTIYGPMVAAGFAAGAGEPGGYDEDSLLNAVRQTRSGWPVKLRGEALVPGEAQGRVLGGCLTLLETSIGTPWDLDTHNSILVLEDRGMKPWQVDRALMHLEQAGKFDGVRGIVLGDFPDCEPPIPDSPTVRDVCVRILGKLKVPIVFNAPFGHTSRPMLTLPLGVKAALRAQGEGMLEILEPAVVE